MERARIMRQARGRWRFFISVVLVTVDIAALGIAETLLLLGVPVTGLGIHLLVLASTPVQAAVAPPRARRLLIALGLVPIARIVGWVVSTLWLSSPASLLLQDGLLAAVFIVAFHTLRLSLRDVGLSLRGLPIQLAIGLIGVPLGVLAWRATDLSPLVAGREQAPPLLALALVVSALVEELLFRGVLQRAAVLAFGGLGIVVASLAYVTMYVPFASTAYLALALATSLFLSWIVLQTKSIVGAALCHAVINVLAFLVMPLLVAPLLAASPPERLAPQPVAFAPIVTPARIASPQPAVSAAFMPLGPAAQGSTTDAGDADTPRVFLVSIGDTLENIAERFDTTEEALLEANGVDSDDSSFDLYPGQVLALPPASDEGDAP
jgi:membrane protease YdiL (CAAX protease family)